MAKGGGVGRALWGQMTTPKSTDNRTTSRRRAAEPPEGVSEAEPGEPKLSELQRRRIVSEARRAAQAAMAEWAADNLPHSSAPRNIQVVASWLMTLRPLRTFHKDVLENGGLEHISGSVELHWGGDVRHNSYSGGNVHYMFNPTELAGSFEDTALVMARAFCNYSNSDEIHEIRGSNWVLLVTVVGRSGSIEQRRYVHKKERGSLKGQLSRELSGIGDIFARTDEELQRRKDRLRERMDAELAIVVADALGHGKDLKKVYDRTYKEVFEEKEADALRELSEDRPRWRRRH